MRTLTFILCLLAGTVLGQTFGKSGAFRGASSKKTTGGGTPANSPEYSTGWKTNNPSASVLTIGPITVAGANKLMMVGAVDGGYAVSSVTWNGSATGWTKLYSTNWYNGSTVTCDLWYLLNPANATANVVVTYAGTADLSACAVLITNAAQSSTFGTTMVNFLETDRGGCTNTVTTTANDLVVDVVGFFQTATPTVGSIQTLRQNGGSVGNASCAMSTAPATTTSTVMSWITAASDRITHIAVPVHPVP